MAQDNKTLGRFILDGIPPAPRGVPQVEVAFDIDANGILSVSAKDKATGKSQSVRIEGSLGLSKEEIEKMKKEAELHAEDDKKKKDIIEARNVADNLIYLSEKTLKEAGNKIQDELKKEIEAKMDSLKKAKDGDSIGDIKNKTADLSQLVQKAGAELYKNQPGEKPKEDGSQPKEGEYKEK